jgi:hypothetical protein
MNRRHLHAKTATSCHGVLRVSAFALLICTLQGCTDPGDGHAVGDLAGAPDRALVETFRLGGVEPIEAEMFDSWPQLVVDADGRLYVLHGRQGRVAVFGPDGGFLRWIGAGSGRGPGELNLPIRVGLLADTIWIRNLNPPHITLFRPDGTLIRTDPVFLDATPGMMSATQGFSGYLTGGRAWVEPDSPPSAWDEGRLPVSALELGTREAGDARDTVLTWRGNRYRMRGLHFDPVPEPPFFAVATDGSAVVLAEWSDDAPGRLGLRTLDPDGSLRWNEDLTVTPRAMSRDERQSIIQDAIDQVDELRENLLEMGLSSAGAPAVPTEAEVRELTFLPSHHPPIRAVSMGVDGTIWLRLEEPGPAERWLALDAEDGVLFRIELPEGARLGQATREAVWYAESDELGVTWVVRAAIRLP